MKTNLHWLMALGTAALGTAIALNSCTTKNQYSSEEITKLVPPITADALDAAGALASCAYSSSTAEFTFQVFNVSRDFRIGIVVQNNLVSNADTLLGRLNTHDFIVTQAVTTYESTDGSVVNIAQQITPSQGLVPAGGTAVVSAVLIPAAVAAQLAGVTSVRLHTHLEGKLLDGSTVSTNEYMPVAIPTSSDTDTSSCSSSATGG
jgi:histidinol dehydrogenase